MKQFQKTILIIFALIVVTGCGPLSDLTSTQRQSEAIASTETALAALPTVTSTSTSTFTPLPSATRIPSATFIPSSTPTETPTATQVIIPTNTKVYVPPATNYGGNCGASLNADFESQVVSLINQQRANNGLSGLASSGALANAARNHTLDMVCNNFVSHTGSNGSSFGTRLNLAGYSYSSAAENVAAGYGSPADVVAGWMGSEGHRANILNAGFTHIGIGYASLSSSTYTTYWTAEFGRP